MEHDPVTVEALRTALEDGTMTPEEILRRCAEDIADLHVEHAPTLAAHAAFEAALNARKRLASAAVERIGASHTVGPVRFEWVRQSGTWSFDPDAVERVIQDLLAAGQDSFAAALQRAKRRSPDRAFARVVYLPNHKKSFQ